MKIAFLISAHRNPDQLRRLARALSSAGDDVFVHIDAKSFNDDFRVISESSNTRLVEPRLRVYHGGFSAVRAMLLLIQEARAAATYDYFVLMSGQCFPTQPIKDLHLKLRESSHDFITLYPMPNHEKSKTLRRLERFHFEAPPLDRLNGRLRSSWLPKRNFIKGLSLWPHAGTTWWALRRKTVEYAMKFHRENPSFGRYLSRTTHSDEVFFHSILATRTPGDFLRPTLTWQAWIPGKKHPIIWTAKDFDMIVQRDAFIVRKVDEQVDNRIIGMLERRVLG